MFREQAGLAEESLSLDVATTADVFDATRHRHGSSEPLGHCKVAVNDAMADWDSPVQDGDTVLLFPPVAGG
jgi:molybdopterin synthase sulfur carrier subunit